MATTTSVNGQTVVHKSSEGKVTSAPDICLTPAGVTVVPIPYANQALSVDTANGSRTVLVDGNPIMLKDSFFSKSTGDEPGVALGITSGSVGGIAKFTNYSFDVKIEGRNVCRRLDPMTGNNGNTPPSPLLQPNTAPGASGEGEEKYPLSLAFVNLHPDPATGRIVQPEFQTLHSVRGAEMHKQEDAGYRGACHRLDRSGGEYGIVFEEFDREPDELE